MKKILGILISSLALAACSNNTTAVDECPIVGRGDGLIVWQCDDGQVTYDIQGDVLIDTSRGVSQAWSIARPALYFQDGANGVVRTECKTVDKNVPIYRDGTSTNVNPAYVRADCGKMTLDAGRYTAYVDFHDTIHSVPPIDAPEVIQTALSAEFLISK